ncbi:MAG: hypothetical protein AB7U75_19955 [Hyphomicrobiaceae bacterium]
MQEVTSTKTSPSERVRRGMRRIALVVVVPALVIATLAGGLATYRFYSDIRVWDGESTYYLPSSMSVENGAKEISKRRVAAGLDEEPKVDYWEAITKENPLRAKVLDAHISHHSAINNLVTWTIFSVAVAVGWFAFWMIFSWVVRGFMKE